MTFHMQDHISQGTIPVAVLFPGAADYMQALNEFKTGTGAINSSEN